MEQQWPLMAVVNGQLGSISPTITLVKDAAERDAKLQDAPPASIAYTAGFGSIWQKDPDGVWQEAE